MTPASFSQIRVVVPDHVVSRVVDGIVVLLNVTSGQTFSLDAVGSRAWALLIESPTVSAASSLLVAEYDALPDVVERDLATLIATLRSRNLLQVQPLQD